MESPMLNEPTWVLDQDESVTTYTRPLLGSELIYDHVLRHNNNLVEVAMGYTFKSSLDKKVLTSRVKDAMGRLRFTAPILGASIKTVEEGKYKRYWTYQPTNDPIAISHWIQDTLIIRNGPFDTDMEGIIAELNATTLPYEHRNGHLQYFGAYLFLGDDNTHCIFFHGTHSLLDAKPNLKAFELLRKWVIEPSLPPLEKLEWGTEWERLPAGPVTSTGGPRGEWLEKGVPLLQHIGASMANPIIPHALKAPRPAIAEFGKVSRARIAFDKDTSLRIIRKLKTLGLGVTYWGEAAHVLATFIANPPSAEEEETAHMNLEHTMISQDRYLVPPHNTASHLISGLSLVPIVVQYKDIPKNVSRKEQLIAIMRIMKAQYDDYLANPHLPHMLHAMCELFPPPPKPWEWPNMNAPMMTNFGIVEQFFTLTPDSGKDEKEVGPMDVIDLRFGHRISYTRIVVHVWTIHSEINFQIQAADNWDKEYIQEQVNLFSEVAKSLLEDDTPRRVEPLSNSSH